MLLAHELDTIMLKFLKPSVVTGRLSKSADVYAFGVLLWEMYTGDRPWSGLGQMQIIFHLTQRKKKLQFPVDTPPQLQVSLAGSLSSL